MALLPSPLDYTDKDEASLRARLQKLATSAFPTWTNFEKANVGNILLELMAHVGGVATFYLDAQAGESRWATAQHRASLLALIKLINYRPRSAASAKVNIVLTFDPPPSAPVLFEKGDTWQTKATTPVRFELVQDYMVPAGTTEYTITGANRTEHQETFSATGLADQEVVLSNNRFLEEDLVVTDSVATWTLVDDFTDSTASDYHFMVFVDQNERATLRFGDGTNGVLPQGTITVTYYTGGGSGGLVEAHTIQAPSSYTDINGDPVFFTATNPDPSSDYKDIESEAEIRENAPKSLRVLERTVSREDFEINAVLAGAARALMLTSNEDPGIAENAGILYIIPPSGLTPSQVLKDAVTTMVTVTKPHTLTFALTVSDPVWVTVDIRARIYLKPGVSNSDAKTAVTDALTAFFAIRNSDGSTNTEVDFGFNYKDVNGDATGELALSSVMNVVRNAQGVRKIGDSSSDFLMNLQHQDLDIGIRGFPRLGTVVLVNGDTGVTM